jgi:hypothetical protein
VRNWLDRPLSHVATVVVGAVLALALLPSQYALASFVILIGILSGISLSGSI